jgi:hypothetical protein
MTVSITWDADAPITGQPDTGTNTKVYTAETAGSVTVADETIGGPSQTVNFTLPLGLTATSVTPDTVDSAGTPAERTVTVAGESFPASTTGSVAIATGPVDALGSTVTSTSAMTNASGIFTGVQLTVPAGQAAGDYHIEAVFAGIGDLSTALTVTAVTLDAPTNIASPSQGPTAIDLTWDAVTDATDYVVRWRVTGETDWTTSTEEITTPAYTVSGLVADTDYDIEVMATAGSAESPWSATFNASTTPDQTLTDPTNFTAGTPTTTTIPTSWDAVTDAETYDVQWRESPAGEWESETAIAATSFEVTGLTADTAYDLQVRAVATGWNPSAWVDITGGPITTAA